MYTLELVLHAERKMREREWLRERKKEKEGKKERGDWEREREREREREKKQKRNKTAAYIKWIYHPLALFAFMSSLNLPISDNDVCTGCRLNKPTTCSEHMADPKWKLRGAVLICSLCVWSGRCTSVWLVCGQGARGTCLPGALSQFVHVIDCDTEIYSRCTCGYLNIPFTTALLLLAYGAPFDFQFATCWTSCRCT